MEIEIIRNNPQEPSLCSFAYQFYRTIEGSLIGHLRRRGKATLYELIDHVVNSRSLRTIHSKKYRNRNIEKLALSKLLTKKHIFIEGQSGTWTLNVIFIQENNAMEYKQQKIVEIKKINESKGKLHEREKIKSTGVKSD